MIFDKVKEFIDKYNLHQETIIVGFSGGYDSMCLLDVLYGINKMQEYSKMNLVAAHFNHNWRGEESLKEQEVCRLFAQERNIEFYTKTAPDNLKKTENDARIARYNFFERAAEQYDTDVVFTAHNKNDNAETVLYRVIKGTGIYGLQGITEHRSIYYRPLLNISRKEILEYSKSKNLTPNNDSSNSNTDYNRNYIRLNIMPELEKINPLAQDALNSLAEVAKLENDIIDEYLKTIKEKIFIGNKIVSSEFFKLSKPVKLRIIYEYIKNLSLDYDWKKINEIYEFIDNNIKRRNGSTTSLAAALWLYADEKTIEILPSKNNMVLQNNFEILINSEGEFSVGSKKFKMKKYTNSGCPEFPQSSENIMYGDFSGIKFPLVLRTRRDGDIINPYGMSGSMKLKKYLNQKGIIRHERDDILLLTKNNEVLWAIGVGISNKIGVRNIPTHVVEIN